MSDRICIQSGGSIQFTFSPEELVSCCSACGFGCSGGFLLPAWQYWTKTGIPSGGDQNSQLVSIFHIFQNTNSINVSDLWT